MKRIAFFAHYDRDGIIDPYVIYYLRGLRAVADRILFASDCELHTGEAAKLEGLAEIVFAGRHGEYDFGSWKRCFERADLGEYDELILANDSCFAPVFPLEPMFEKMRSDPCDFWGPALTLMDKGRDHLCSFFLVFRRPVIESQAFLDFFAAVEPQPSVKEVIARYEIGLSQMLRDFGFRFGSPFPPMPLGHNYGSEFVHAEAWKLAFPFWKTRLFRENPLCTDYLGDALDDIANVYPRRLIDAYVERMIGSADPAHYRFRPPFHFRLGALEIESKIVSGKKKRRKTSASLFGKRVFALSLPTAAPQST